jgi:L-threonylcarbamoyladenylate synthase
MSHDTTHTTEQVKQAVAILQAGGFVALPTETVYGLGADASNESAVRRIFTAKGRPADHPLIVHLASVELLSAWAINVPDVAYLLADAFWPGPLTLILQRAPEVLDVVTGGQDTVGLRVPGHPLALELLKAFGGGVAAPSANRFGRISPTTAEHVRAELGERVDLILDGGPCQVGLESTIIDLSTGRPRLLRPGGVSMEALAAVLGEAPEVGAKKTPRASGTLASHYAPTTPAVIVPSEELIKYLHDHAGKALGVLARQEKTGDWLGAHWRHLPTDVQGYGRRLYASLRELDGLGCDRIIIEDVPPTPEWLVVRDRITRAATPAQEQTKGEDHG